MNTTITVNRIEVILKDVAQILHELGQLEAAKALQAASKVVPVILVPTDWEFVEKCDVEVEGTVSKYVPASFRGHPDNWYPEEGGEVEITSVTCVDYDIVLTADEQKLAEEALVESCRSDG